MWAYPAFVSDFLCHGIISLSKCSLEQWVSAFSVKFILGKYYNLENEFSLNINLEIYVNENMPKIEAAEVAQNIETIFISFFSLL